MKIHILRTNITDFETHRTHLEKIEDTTGVIGSVNRRRTDNRKRKRDKQ